MNELIIARLAATFPGLSIPHGQVPDEIQWMPPGAHKIQATQAGKVVDKSVVVTERTAQRMQSLLDQVQAAAASGTEDRPFIDFNHDDAEAAGHVLGFRWAGDDPVSGGVRARIEWTQPGRSALEGRLGRLGARCDRE